MKSLPEVIAAVQLLQKAETECTKITHEIKQEISDLQMKVSELIQLLLLLFKKVSSARLGESDIHPSSPKTPAPQYKPIDRKKRKGERE